MALHLADPHTRCAICGLPTRMLKAYHRIGIPLPKNAYGSVVSILTVDHITPGGPSTLENTRPLCIFCNTTRGPALLSDEEVLRRATKYWVGLLGAARTWWLNTTPGQGGRPSRVSSAHVRSHT